MSILNLIALDGFIVVNKALMKLFGLEAALILGELASEHNYWEREGKLDDGFFYSTAENIEANTTLSRYQQNKAVETLEKTGILITAIKGMPATKYFKINQERLIEIMQMLSETSSQDGASSFKKFESKIAKNLKTSLKKTCKLDCKKLEGNNNKELETRKVSKKETNKEKTSVEVNFDAFMQTYNNTCINLPKVREISDKREKAIKKFLTKYSAEDFQEVCKKANASDFLTGKSGNGFRGGFDFLIKLDNALKILEGTYDNSPAQQQKQQKQPRTNKFQNFEERNYDFEKLEAAMEAENEREYQKTIQAKLNKDIGFEIADGVTGNFKPQQQAQTNNSFINTLRNDYGRKDTSNATIRQFT